LLGDLELHRQSGLSLDHRRSIANPPAGANIVDPQPQSLSFLSWAAIGRHYPKTARAGVIAATKALATV
jgi:hypothetical protein